MAQPHCAIVLPQPMSSPFAWLYSSLPHRAQRWLKSGAVQPSPLVPPTLVSVTEPPPPGVAGFVAVGVGSFGVGVAVALSSDAWTPNGSLVSHGWTSSSVTVLPWFGSFLPLPPHETTRAQTSSTRKARSLPRVIAQRW